MEWNYSPKMLYINFKKCLSQIILPNYYLIANINECMGDSSICLHNSFLRAFSSILDQSSVCGHVSVMPYLLNLMASFCTFYGVSHLFIPSPDLHLSTVRSLLCFESIMQTIASVMKCNWENIRSNKLYQWPYLISIFWLLFNVLLNVVVSSESQVSSN